MEKKLKNTNQNYKAVNNSITVESLPKGEEKFIITLPKGKLSQQKLEVLLEFYFLAKPYKALSVLHHLLINYFGKEFCKMEDDEALATEELLLLFTNLWAAEHNAHNTLDILDLT